jgi:hypothetical protein
MLLPPPYMEQGNANEFIMITTKQEKGEKISVTYDGAMVYKIRGKPVYNTEEYVEFSMKQFQ